MYQQGYSRIYLREISVLEYFSVDLRRNWTRRFEKSSGSDIGIGGGERVVPLAPLSLVEVGIHKRLFRCQCTVIVELAEERFGGVEWAVSFANKAAKEEDFREV